MQASASVQSVFFRCGRRDSNLRSCNEVETDFVVHIGTRVQTHAHVTPVSYPLHSMCICGRRRNYTLCAWSRHRPRTIYKNMYTPQATARSTWALSFGLYRGVGGAGKYGYDYELFNSRGIAYFVQDAQQQLRDTKALLLVEQTAECTTLLSASEHRPGCSGFMHMMHDSLSACRC